MKQGLIALSLCAALVSSGCATAKRQRTNGWAVLVGGAIADGIGTGIAIGTAEDGEIPWGAIAAISAIGGALVITGLAMIFTSYSREAAEKNGRRGAVGSPGNRNFYFIPESNCDGKRCKSCPRYARRSSCTHEHGPCRLVRDPYYRLPCPAPKPVPKGHHPALPDAVTGTAPASSPASQPASRPKSAAPSATETVDPGGMR